MATALTFQPTIPDTPIYQTVYTKDSWSDEWEIQSQVICTSATWTIAPQIATATLRNRYGDTMPPGATQWQMWSRLNLAGKYVRILFEDNLGQSSWNWYGIIRTSSDQRMGAYGVETFLAYGMESLLQEWRPETSRWRDNANQEFGVDMPIPFNERGFSNRTQSPEYVFDGGKRSYYDTTHDWSTRQVVEYLLANETPRDFIGQRNITFQLVDTLSLLPTHDRPVVEREGRTTWEILNALMPRQRLLSFTTEVQDSGVIQVVPLSFNASQLTLPSGQQLAANPNQYTFSVASDTSGSPTLRFNQVDTYDVVRIWGARPRCCFTASKADSTLEDGWPSTLETAYETGADLTGLSAGDLTAKRRRHEEHRRSDKFRPVYARWRIPFAWDGKANNGLNSGYDRPVDPINEADPTNAIQGHDFYPPRLQILSSLPLLSGHDYSGDNIKNGTVTKDSEGPFSELPPLCITPLLEDTSWYVNVESIGVAAEWEESETASTDRRWTGSVQVVQGEAAIHVQVIGQPQHFIAATAFSGQAEDITPQWDYDDFIFTIAVEAHRRLKAQVPENPPPSPVDYVRTMDVFAGDEWRLDYVVPDTIVLVADDGTITRSNGGYVRNDKPALQELASLAYQWYSQDRATLSYATKVWHPTVEVGSLVLSVDGTTANTVISSITIDTPIATGADPEPATITYETSFADLDVLRL